MTIEDVVRAVIAALRGGKVLQGPSRYSRRHVSVGPYRTATGDGEPFALYQGNERMTALSPRPLAAQFVLEVGTDAALEQLTRED